MLERERKAAEAAAAKRAVQSVWPVHLPQPPQPTPTTTTARHPLDESKGIEEETARRLAAMSVSEIEDAQSTIAAKLKPSALEFFRKRGGQALGQIQTGDRGGSGSSCVSSGIGGGCRDQRERVPARSSAGIHPADVPPALDEEAPALPGPPRRGGARRPRSRRRHHGVEGRVDIRRGVCSLHPGGRALNADEQPAAGRQASRLGSAVERDPPDPARRIPRIWATRRGSASSWRGARFRRSDPWG